MTPVDDLKVGMYVAVCGDKEAGGNKRFDSTFTGEPCRIVAISLPFVAIFVPRDGYGDTIDVRRYELVKLSRAFVNAVLAMPRSDANEEPQGGQPGEVCPACGATTSIRCGVCLECGYSGDS